MGLIMIWSYGVTTVPSRIDTTLPTTLRSLKAGGFDKPHLFIDGGNYAAFRDRFGLPHTFRGSEVRVHGNWVLSLYELFIRRPDADRYAVFQDDFITYPNLRKFLESSKYPEKGYLNLYTFRAANENLVRGKPIGWYESSILNGGQDPNRMQTGRGAVALVFDQPAVLTLLSSRHFLERPLDCVSGHRRVDGGIVTAMNKAGWREYIHNPSLVQHTGETSTIGNDGQKKAATWMGEGFDAMRLLDDPHSP